jgi:putative transposase
LLPNHFHLVLWPRADEQVGPWMQWLLTAHGHGYRQRYGGSGHVWQGRFRAFPVEQDDHLLAVLRYVERNPLRAGLVERAEGWPWSSLSLWHLPPLCPWLDAGPVPRPPDWLAQVQAVQTEGELAAVQGSVQRGAPFGSSAWVEKTARELGLEASLRPGGRPRQAGSSEPERGGLFSEKQP